MRGRRDGERPSFYWPLGPPRSLTERQEEDFWSLLDMMESHRYRRRPKRTFWNSLLLVLMLTIAVMVTIGGIHGFFELIVWIQTNVLEPSEDVR